MIVRGPDAMPNALTSKGIPGSPHRDAGAVFEALVMASALKPLARALGFYGDAVVASAANAIFLGAGALAVPPEAPADTGASRVRETSMPIGDPS